MAERVKVDAGRLLFLDNPDPDEIRKKYCPECPLNVTCEKPHRDGGSTFANTYPKTRERLADSEIQEKAACINSTQ